MEITDGEAPPDIVTEDIDDAPVVKYVTKILLDAINGGASDMHFEPYEKFYRIRYRTDGILYDVAQPPLAIKEKIASRIKVVSKLDISEKRVPQDGRMKMTLSKTRAIDFRVSTLPTLLRREDLHADPRSVERHAGHRRAGLRGGAEGIPDARHPAPLRDGAGDGPHGLGQDSLALHVPQHPQQAGHQHLDGGGPRGDQPRGHQPGAT